MADIALAIHSERWLDEVVLSATKANIDSDQGDAWVLPPGVGHCAIMEVMVEVSGIATVRTAVEDAGIRGLIINAAGDIAVDFIGNAPWRLVNGAPAGAGWVNAYISPDPLVEWKEGEKLELFFPEIDVNATPTGDLRVYVKVVRVRPGVVAPEKLKLVR